MQRIVELAAPQPAEQTVALESPLPADEDVPDEVFEGRRLTARVILSEEGQRLLA